MSYASDNAWDRARQRLEALERWLDPGTIRHLMTLGVAPGWSCLEVGAGGGSIATWLADRVGGGGSVLATDINPRFVGDVDRPNLEVREHDITSGPPAREAFHLAHARLVLMHLPERERALRHLVEALRPGCWLLIEEMDFISVSPDGRCDPSAARLFAKLVEAHHTVMRARGFDPEYGRELLRALRSAGLTEIDAEGRVSLFAGGSAGAVAWQLTFEQLRDEIVAAGAASEGEIAEVIALLADPDLTLSSQVTMAAWGRRPVA
jgi:SAM-dependent methyltransferase